MLATKINSGGQHDRPLATVLAGGYAARVEDTVDIHTATIESMMSDG